MYRALSSPLLSFSFYFTISPSYTQAFLSLFLSPSQTQASMTNEIGFRIGFGFAQGKNGNMASWGSVSESVLESISWFDFGFMAQDKHGFMGFSFEINFGFA